jgi:hypothetical protein
MYRTNQEKIVLFEENLQSYTNFYVKKKGSGSGDGSGYDLAKKFRIRPDRDSETLNISLCYESESW